MKNNQTSGGEFEREPVPDSALLGAGKFWGMYAGEHAAGTEFMIGPLFLAAGASLQDLILGLLLGNFLAVLTWRFLVTPIAMAKRMTLYYQLERIAGGSLVKFYNVVNGLLFCFLAGAMVTVSASAVGVPFGITFDVPEAMFGLSNPSFTALVAIVGIVIAVVAAGGYETVARVANIAAPWMIAVFAACGIVSLGADGRDQHGCALGRQVLDRCDRVRPRKEWSANVRVLADRRLRLALQRSDALWHGRSFDLSIRPQQSVRLGACDRHVSRSLHGVDRGRIAAGRTDQDSTDTGARCRWQGHREPRTARLRVTRLGGNHLRGDRRLDDRESDDLSRRPGVPRRAAQELARRP